MALCRARSSHQPAMGIDAVKTMQAPFDMVALQRQLDSLMKASILEGENRQHCWVMSVPISDLKARVYGNTFARPDRHTIS